MSSEHPPTAVSFPPCQEKRRFPSWHLEKGHQPRRVLGQEVHPGPAARSEHPDKGLPGNTALGELQGFFFFFDVACLGADGTSMAQWFRSKNKVLK